MNKYYFKPGEGVVEDPETVEDNMVELEDVMVINGRQTELQNLEYFVNEYDERIILDDGFTRTIRQLTAEEKTERERLLALVKQANALLAEAEKGGLDERLAPAPKSGGYHPAVAETARSGDLHLQAP